MIAVVVGYRLDVLDQCVGLDVLEQFTIFLIHKGNVVN